MNLSPFGFPLETMIIFILLLFSAFALDWYAHKNDHPISLKNAVWWSMFWVGISMIFGMYLWIRYGSDTASLFFTGYALEKVLSVDNLFVIMAIFSWFKIPDPYRHRVLYWGIFGAIIFRLVFVAVGTGLLALFGTYLESVFALLIAWSAWLMLGNIDKQNAPLEDYSDHMAYRWVHRFFPVWPQLYQNRFFLRNRELRRARELYPEVCVEFAGEDVYHPKKSRPRKLKQGQWVATPLFLCLAVIELSDVMFAFDSVPAVIAVSREPLIIYSAMIFAIMGLRTLYFVLEALKDWLVHLEKAVVILLFFIAFKLLLSVSDHIWGHGLVVSANASLVTVMIVLATGIGASFVLPEHGEPHSVIKKITFFFQKFIRNTNKD